MARMEETILEGCGSAVAGSCNHFPLTIRSALAQRWIQFSINTMRLRLLRIILCCYAGN